MHPNNTPLEEQNIERVWEGWSFILIQMASEHASSPIVWRNNKILLTRWRNVRYGIQPNGHYKDEDPLDNPDVREIRDPGNNGGEQEADPVHAQSGDIYRSSDTSS